MHPDFRFRAPARMLAAAMNGLSSRRGGFHRGGFRRSRLRHRAGLAFLAAAAVLVAGLVTPAVTPRALAASCGTSNVALKQTATASSTESAGTPAADAVDGNTGTRWSSAFADPQWLEVDLGSSQSICQVGLQWETARPGRLPFPAIGCSTARYPKSQTLTTCHAE